MGRVGGYGVYCGDARDAAVFLPPNEKQTNNRGELRAALHALQHRSPHEHVANFGPQVPSQALWIARTGLSPAHNFDGLGGGGGGAVDRGVWTAKTVKRPRQQPAHPQYANYWAPLTCKRHIPPHPAQPQHTKYWVPRTRKRHQQEHRPQRPTERSDPTQHAEGRTGDRPGPRKGATTGRNVTRGRGGGHAGPCS